NNFEFARLGKLVKSLLLDAVALRVGKFFVQIAEALRGHVLLVVYAPDLILALVLDACVLGFLDLDLEFVELAGKPTRGLGCGFVTSAVVLLDVRFQMGIDHARGKLRVSGLETDFHQAAVGDALDAEATEKGADLRRAFLVGEAPGGNRLRRPVAGGETWIRSQAAVADSLQGQRLAGKNLGILAVDFDSGSGDINGAHTEGGNTHDGNNREQEGKDQPLMLAQDEQVVVEMGLARGEINVGKAGCGAE